MLEPERPLGAARLALLVAANALADALGVLGPPEVPLGWRWPGILLVNGGDCGRLRLASPAGVRGRRRCRTGCGRLRGGAGRPAGREPGADAGPHRLEEEGLAGLDGRGADRRLGAPLDGRAGPLGGRGAGAAGGGIPRPAGGVRPGRGSTRRRASWCWSARRAAGCRWHEAAPHPAAGSLGPGGLPPGGAGRGMGGARRLRLLGRGSGGAGGQAAAGIPRRLPRPRQLRLVHPGGGGGGRPGRGRGGGGGAGRAYPRPLRRPGCGRGRGGGAGGDRLRRLPVRPPARHGAGAGPGGGGGRGARALPHPAPAGGAASATSAPCRSSASSR